jgi:hypothetical protein
MSLGAENKNSEVLSIKAAAAPVKSPLLRRALVSKKLKLIKSDKGAEESKEPVYVADEKKLPQQIEPRVVKSVAKAIDVTDNEKAVDDLPVVEETVGKHITKIPFNSLDISENTKKALSSVLKFE